MALTTAQIQQAYVTFFSRPADPVGLAYWQNYSGSVADLYATFAQQSEYSAAFSGLSSAQKVNVVYQNLFGRDAEASGLLYWAGQLEAGKVTVANLALAVSAGSQGTDKVTVDSRVSAATSFTAALDTAAEVLGYSGATANASAKTWLAGVTTAANLATAVAAIDTAVASTVAVGGAAGSTFTLTGGIDAFAGTAGNDTFIADATTAASSDQIIGGAGTDTLKLYGAAAEPTHSGVEVVYLNGNTAGFDVSDDAAVTALQLVDATTAQTYTIKAGQTVSAATMANSEVIDFAGNTVTSLDLTVNALGTTSGAGVTVDLNSTAQTTLSLTAATAASNVVLANTGAKLVTVNISGDKALTLDADANTVLLTTVNAAASTGGVTINLDDDGTAKNITVTGGTGNDTANYGAHLTKSDVFDGGAGTDTLKVTQASVTTVQAYDASDKATLNANLSNIEKLNVSDISTSDIDVTRFDGVNSVTLAAGFGVADNNVDTVTISGLVSGATIEVDDVVDADDIIAASITDATAAGHNADVLNVVLNDSGAGGASDIGILNAVGVDVLNIEAKNLTSAGAVGTQTGYTLDIKSTSTALDKIVVTGTIALDIDGVALVNSINEVDASGMVLTAVTATGLAVDIAASGTDGVLITGSMGVDTIGGGDGADTINGGSGVDTITAGAGDDLITTGAGNDIVVVNEADGSITSSHYDTITDYTNGTTAGTTDKITYENAGTVGVATGMTGWTVTNGVATKTGATLADFITAAGLADTANNVVAFVVGDDTWVYNNGANDDGSTADDSLIKLVGVKIESVVTTDTIAANELFIG